MDTGHKHENTDRHCPETARTNRVTRSQLFYTVSSHVTQVRYCSSTFAVSVELLLLPAELIVELAVELHLQHLGEHQVTGGVTSVV